MSLALQAPAGGRPASRPQAPTTLWMSRERPSPLQLCAHSISLWLTLCCFEHTKHWRSCDEGASVMCRSSSGLAWNAEGLDGHQGNAYIPGQAQAPTSTALPPASSEGAVLRGGSLGEPELQAARDSAHSFEVSPLTHHQILGTLCCPSVSQWSQRCCLAMMILLVRTTDILSVSEFAWNSLRSPKALLFNWRQSAVRMQPRLHSGSTFCHASMCRVWCAAPRSPVSPCHDFMLCRCLERHQKRR